ncbi:serine proteinase stubble [Eupeodes corollae]|uniref:serine proteinase stubble n=1 Tax=Eupeodes corollae TaxID=290404 RepID=UPI002490D97D|nr:serine proteinase stubble [Eupeodes corollae]XP_055904987.1 serine proteinase stubble [Eupeodes corollae]XP_055904988.1 serine proteinase stubble [Eupeodes corollae]
MPVIGNHIFSTMWSRWLVSPPVILLYYQIVLTISNCLSAVPLAAEAAYSGAAASDFIISSSGSNSGNNDGSLNNRHLRYSDSLSDTYSNSYDSISDNSYDHLPVPEPLLPSLSAPYQQRSQSYKISPKPCTIGSIDGTCMFVWECIKSEGQHVGMCVDTFMFGSCCAHNLTQNIIMPQTFSFTRPPPSLASSAYLPSSSGHHKPRPPSSISGVTTIERPHGAGTLVVRHPPGPHHQTVITHHHGSSNYFQPQYQKPVTSSSTSSSSSPLSTSSSTLTYVSTTKNPSLTNSLVDMETSASISSSLWNTSPQTIQWHMTTQPNFITKPRPPVWEKPSKPIKPSKKPIQTQASFMTTRRPIVTSGNFPTKTKPQTFGTKPTKPATTTRPYSPYFSSSSNAPQTSTTSRPMVSSNLYFPSTHHSSPSPTPSSSYPTFIYPTSSKPTKGPIKFPTSTSTTPSVFPVRFTPPPLNHTTIESNEILNHVTTNDNPIKTISAARSECGVPSLARPETRIVGGKSAPFGRWPWQVSVRRTSFFGFSSTHRCGGALINENWIATAGHCVDDLLTSQIRIRVGEYDFSHVQEQLPYIERGVSKKVVHPKYNFFTYEYDLALVKLEQPLEFAPHVSPICLPSTDSLLIGMNATVTGWGRLSEGGTLPSVLQEVSVPIVSNDRCKSMFLRAGRQEFIPDIFLCAGYETGGQDSCQGDSGGPLQVKSQDGRFFLAGIISWGIGCAEANLPGVCTRISKFVPWIMENVV